MAAWRWLILWLPVLLADDCPAVDLMQRKLAVEPINTTRLGYKTTYGKYHTSDGDDFDNSLFVYYPFTRSSVKRRPVAFFFHMGGLSSEGSTPLNESSEASDDYNARDVVYVAVGYRLLNVAYYYTANGSEQLEEQVYIQSDGRLDLDPDRTYQDFKPRVDIASEGLAKTFYDVVQAFDYVISRADEFGIDPHRVILTGASIGSGLANYLALIHQSLNPERFTIKAVAYTIPQINYPVAPNLDMAWRQWANFVGREAPLSSYIDNTSCSCIMGSAWCSGCGSVADYPYLSCNESWNAIRMEKFCLNDQFKDYTIGDVIDFQRWSEDEGSLSARLPMLWYAERNYKELRPNFSLIVSSALNGSDVVSIVHHTIFVANYARLADRLGIPYVAYHTSWAGMTEADTSNALQIEQGSTTWYLKSSMDWHAELDRRNLTPASTLEQVVFTVLALGDSNEETPKGGASSMLPKACKAWFLVAVYSCSVLLYIH